MPEKAPGDPVDRLLLVDGHSLAYRAFYALPVENFATTTGQPTNAVFGFTSMLINTLKEENPTRVCVAFDVARQTFRTTEYPEYKANRSKSPDEFKGQVELVKGILAGLDIKSAEVAGYEADDVIATLTHQAKEQGLEVLILSGDRDALQLVDDTTTVLYPRKGVSDLARMTPAAIQDKYGVPPDRYSDMAALVGETSDNLPGVPGVGQGYAAKWLNEYGSLSGIVDNVDQIPGKKGEALREHLAQVLTNRQLNQLVSDVELDVEIADLELAPFERQRIHEVFDPLEFRVLRERLFEYLDDSVAREESAVAVNVAVLEPDQIGAWLDELPTEKPVAVTFDPDSQLLGLAPNDDSAGVLQLPAPDSRAGTSLADWLGGPEEKVVHDLKFTEVALQTRGYSLSGVAIDTALAAYLALPGQRSFDLADLVPRFLGRELQLTKSDDQLTLDVVGDETDQADSVAAAAVATRQLAQHLGDTLRDRGGLALLTKLEMPVAEVLAEMEAAGIAVDTALLRQLESEFATEAKAAEAVAFDVAGHPFNLGSPKQLQEVLFVERGLPKTRKIKTGWTTDADALGKLFEQTQDPLLEQILTWRDVTKLKQTVAGLLPLVDSHGRIHTTFNQVIAATGRLSSQEPNLQNIPIRTAAGQRIRAAFVPGVGYDSLLTADYSQIEMRIMAHLSADEGLIAAFKSGEDLHSTVAASVFNCAPGDVDAEMRRKIKAMSYGLAYGLSAFGLSNQLNISTGEASDLMNEYFARFGGIRDYLEEVVAQARATGYTETMLGRRRYLPDLNSDNRQRRQMAERMALNAPIQGSAADIVKVAMVQVAQRLQAEGLGSRLLLQVHDELVIELIDQEQDQVTEIVVAEMASAADMAVPLDVQVGIGPNWDAAAH